MKYFPIRYFHIKLGIFGWIVLLALMASLIIIFYPQIIE